MARRNVTELRLELTGDASGAIAALRSMAREGMKADATMQRVAQAILRALDEVEQKTESVARRQRQTGGGGFGDALRSTAAARVDQLGGGGIVGDLLGNLGGAETALAGISTRAVAAAGGLAVLGTAAVQFGQRSVDSFASVGGEIRKFQQTLGGTAEDASRFWFAMSASGVNPEQGLDALNQFSVNVTQNADDLRTFGVEIARTEQGGVDLAGTMLNVVDRYHELGDAAERARLLSVTFGEEGMRQLQPLIARGSESFRQLREDVENVFTGEDMKRLDEYTRKIEESEARIRLAEAETGAKLAPAKSWWARFKAEFVEDMVDFGTFVGGAVGAVEDATGDLVRGVDEAMRMGRRAGTGGDDDGRRIRAIAQDWDAVKGSVSDVGRAASQAAPQVARLLSETDKAALAQQRLQSSQAWMTEAIGSEADASRTLADARSDHADAVADLAQAEADAARTISDANRQAARAVSSAQEQVRDAYEQAAEMVADAESRITDAHQDHAEAVEELREAELDAQRVITDANEDAADRIAAAEERVAEARERASRTARDNARSIQDAEQAVRDALSDALTEDNPFEAQRRREEALLRLQRTREDVAESEQDAARDVAEAEQDLRDAFVEAQERRQDAAERAAEIIEGAQERVRGASQRVAEAQAAHAQAQVDAAARVQGAEVNLAQVTADAEYNRQVSISNALATVEAARRREIELANAVIVANSLVEQSIYRVEAAQRALFMAAHLAQPRVANPNDPRSRTLQHFTGPVPGVARRQHGGPVHPNSWYLVGENGPEPLFTGNTSGRVFPNGSGLGGGGVTVIVQNLISERELTQLLSRLERRGVVGRPVTTR